MLLINLKINAITVTLNHKEIWKHPGRVTKIKPVIDKYH